MAEEKTVPPALANLALDALVRQFFEVSWGKARAWIETGKVFVDGQAQTVPRTFLKAGAVIELRMNSPRPSKGLGGCGTGPVLKALLQSQVVYVDSQIVVLDKPPGISTVPYQGPERGRPREASESGTLLDLAAAHLGQSRLEVVHRIDKETSGLVVFARNREAGRKLANQFRFHSVERRYLALAHGVVKSQTFRSLLITNRGDGLRGSAPAGWHVAKGGGQLAVTHVAALECLRGATYVECRLETGRTHQIRIHLSEAGHPLLGEKLYIRDFRGELQAAPRVMLHATELGFEHPVTGAAMSWQRQPPEDFLALQQSLTQV